MAAKRKVIVIGGGLGGLWAALTLANRGFEVDLLSLFEVKRSHSACAQGGINAVLDTKGQRDSVQQREVPFVVLHESRAHLATSLGVRHSLGLPVGNRETSPR